jgi:hypothetical protein
VVKLAQEEAARGDAANIEKFKQQCDRLIGFTEYRYPRYRTSPHHRFIATHLERVERREIDRLMILMPPRHGKSELASKSYPAWTIGRNPWKQFISASATADLAHDWGRDVRNTVASEAYQVNVLMSKTRKGSYVVGDVVRFRGRPDVVRDRIVETARPGRYSATLLAKYGMRNCRTWRPRLQRTTGTHVVKIVGFRSARMNGSPNCAPALMARSRCPATAGSDVSESELSLCG